MRITREQWATPVATLVLATDDEGVLRALDFLDHEPRMHRLLRLHYGEVTLRDGKTRATIKQRLADYFRGDLGALNDVSVATGGTAFQRAVWQALRSIPAGTTMSYGQIAAAVGRQGASRAVGAANGANPISIVVPCHRVIGANGALTGYAGGLRNKRWLLEHEQQFLLAASSEESPALCPS